MSQPKDGFLRLVPAAHRVGGQKLLASVGGLGGVDEAMGRPPDLSHQPEKALPAQMPLWRSPLWSGEETCPQGAAPEWCGHFQSQLEIQPLLL